MKYGNCDNAVYSVGFRGQVKRVPSDATRKVIGLDYQLSVIWDNAIQGVSCLYFGSEMLELDALEKELLREAWILHEKKLSDDRTAWMEEQMKIIESAS